MCFIDINGDDFWFVNIIFVKKTHNEADIGGICFPSPGN